MISIIRHGEDSRRLDYDEKNCAGCGLCSIACPNGAIKYGPPAPIARGIKDANYIVIDEEKCNICGLCTAACPFDSLDLKLNDVSTKQNPDYPHWTHKTIVDDEECIYCGQCEVACPVDAVHMTRQYPERKEFVSGEIILNEDKCTYCGICSEICPAEVVTVNSNKGEESIHFDEDKCVYCKLCKRLCPTEALDIVCSICMNSETLPSGEVTGEVNISQHKCISCGLCSIVCPRDAISVTKPFTGSVGFVSEDYKCRGEKCSVCVDVCKCNAITIGEDDRPHFNEDLCVLCGACQLACPFKSIIVSRDSSCLENVKSASWLKHLSKIM